VSHPYLDAPPLALAHRGGDVDGLENSLAAFQDAVDLGYRYLETDVHATADGRLVAFHDDVLDRATDRTGAIASLTWDEVSRARIGGREPIPRLEAVIAAFPQARLNLDVKSDRAVAPLVQLLGHLDVTDRVCVGSFSDARLAAVRAAHPHLCRSAGPDEVRRLRLRSRLGPLGRSRPRGALDRLLGVDADCVQVPVTHGDRRVVDEAFVATCHRLGLQVHVWTVNEPGHMRALLDLGVDGLVTDRTRELRAVLTERGAWTGDDPGA
jgi:glycerophosphoryl diester phosphodiesterase